MTHSYILLLWVPTYTHFLAASPPAHSQIHKHLPPRWPYGSPFKPNAFIQKKLPQSLPKYLLNAARACIPYMWKQQSPSTVTQLLARVNDIQCMEHLTSALRNKFEEHKTRWFYRDLVPFSNEYYKHVQAYTCTLPPGITSPTTLHGLLLPAP